jgi:hypothetical protein
MGPVSCEEICPKRRSANGLQSMRGVCLHMLEGDQKRGESDCNQQRGELRVDASRRNRLQQVDPQQGPGSWRQLGGLGARPRETRTPKYSRNRIVD